jgi:NAD(P)H-dependent flavin oxidoreductase YrpB (nitropropane dioxygenase family)
VYIVYRGKIWYNIAINKYIHDINKITSLYWKLIYKKEIEMIKTRLTQLLGIKYPIIQAGMGPFPVTELCISASNAGCLGILSTAAPSSKDIDINIFESFCKAAGAETTDDDKTIFRKMFIKVFEETKESQGIFGANVMVSAEMLDNAKNVIDTMIELRNEFPEMKERFKVLITSAGDPLPWSKIVKDNDLIWMHVLPSVKAAKRCKKAGVDVLIASGHEGGFHTAWQPIHSIVLTPDVVEQASDDNTLVVACGGFCDGKTLAAALALGADGIQMGTRFLATQESDFAPLWKDLVVEAGDGGTIVARGFVGPARWLKTPRSIEHAKNTVVKAPGTYIGIPDDYSTIDMSLIDFENESLAATASGDREKAMAAAGESSQRINDLPKTADMVQKIVSDAEEIIADLAKKYIIK